MSRSAGPGSPISFLCAKHRRIWYGSRTTGGHRCRLTGRSRPYSPQGCLGVRSRLTSVEYRCACGHVGWTNHGDMVDQESSSEAFNARLKEITEKKP